MPKRFLNMITRKMRMRGANFWIWNMQTESMHEKHTCFSNTTAYRKNYDFRNLSDGTSIKSHSNKAAYFGLKRETKFHVWKSTKKFFSYFVLWNIYELLQSKQSFIEKNRPDICKIYACLYVFVGCPFKPLMHMQKIPLVAQWLDC